MLNRGEISADDFVKEFSGINFAYTKRKELIMEQIRAGQYTAARDQLATEVVEQTMFRYRTGQSGYRGMIGKMFGMFGTYPVHYVESIGRGWRAMNSTPAKLAFAATFVTNSMALYAAFKGVLGVNANNFLPWQPALFSGGPLFNTMWDSYQAIFGTGYQGRQMRAKMFGWKKGEDGRMKFVPWDAELAKWVPFGFQIDYIRKGVKALAEGDQYRALLNFTGTPTNKLFFDYAEGNRFFNPNAAFDFK
jgi:hypothetical protein